MGDDYDWDEDRWSDVDYLGDYIEAEMQNQSEESVRSYLQKYGDAVVARVEQRLAESEKLVEAGFMGPSLVVAIAAIEVVIRYLVLMPLLQGAFMSEYWSAVLTERLLPDRAGTDRRLLPAVLSEWDIALDDLTLSNGDSVWGVLDKRLYRARNAFVHRGAETDEETAQLGLESAQVFLKDLGQQIAARFGLSWPQTMWHRRRVEKDGKVVLESYRPPADPF